MDISESCVFGLSVVCELSDRHMWTWWNWEGVRGYSSEIVFAFPSVPKQDPPPTETLPHSLLQFSKAAQALVMVLTVRVHHVRTIKCTIKGGCCGRTWVGLYLRDCNLKALSWLCQTLAVQMKNKKNRPTRG